MSTPSKPNGTPNHQDEIPIAQLRPSSPGCGLLEPGALTKVLVARTKDAPGYDSGYEITWVRPRRSFRVDHFRGGVLAGTRWIPEGRVDEYVEA